MKTPKLCLAIVLLVTFLPAALRASESSGPVTDEYVHRVWSERDGLISSRIWSITQDQDGYLWLGSDMGLLRFDGVRAVFQPTRSQKPRPEDRALALLAARDGSIWVGFGAAGGITHVTGRGPLNYGPEQGLLTGRVTDIAEDVNGDIWVSAIRGLFTFHDGTWNSIGAASRLPAGQVNGVYIDPAGTLIASTPEGIYRKMRRQSTFTLISSVRNVQAVQFALHHPTGLLVTDDHVGFAAVTPNASVPRQSSHFGRGIQLLSDSSDRLWLATEARGLWAIDFAGGRSENVELSSHEGVDSNTVRALFEDREGNLWVGTLSGLHEFTPRVVSAVPRIETPFAILNGDSGHLLVGSAGALADVSPTEQITSVNESVAGASHVRALYRDGNGILWLGSDDGVFRIIRNRPVLVREAAHLRNVTSFAGARDGTVYLCDQHKGLFRWRDGTLTAFTHPLDREGWGAVSVYGDREDRIWIGYVAGHLGLIDRNGGAQWFGRAEGLTTGVLNSIYEDREGALWVGGSGGLSRYNGHHFLTIYSERERVVNGIAAVTEDAQGDMWLGVTTGIVHFRKADFDLAVASGAPLRHARYDQADGLAGLPIWLAAGPTSAAAPDGRLWFVTSGGLSVIDPLRLAAHVSSPGARVETVEMLPPATNRLGPIAKYFLPPTVRVEYTALSFRAPTKLRFRYRLEGYDSDWVDADSTRDANYVNLQPGRYRFAVLAADSAGIWSEHPAYAEVIVPTPPLRTRWAYATGILAFTGIGLGLWSLRLRRVKGELAVVLAERTRMSHEIHDTLLQGLVGIALQLDATSSSVTDPRASQQLSYVRRRVEQYIGDAREAIKSLRLRDGKTVGVWDALERTGRTLAETHGFHFGMKRSLGSSFPESRTCEQQLLRIGQEAIANAATHGHPTRVYVDVEYTRSATVLRVSDDGCGFSPAYSSDEHFGLRIMRERAQQVGGHLEIQSNPGQGTSVIATVPHA